jgi:hypothetical protein
MLRHAQLWRELLQGTFRERVVALWLLWGCVLALAMVSSALWHHGFRGFFRRCALDLQYDWSRLMQRRLDHDLDYAQRWSMWFLSLGSVNLLIVALGAAARGDQDPNPILMWVAITVFVLALLSPVAMYVDARVEAGRLNHLAQEHPLLARLLWYKSLGWRRPSVSYTRRCRRFFCILR